MAIIKHKRGLPFNKKCKWLNDFGNPVNLTAGGITVKSQIRHPATDQLIADLIFSKISDTEFRLRAANTDDWPLDRLVWDIVYQFDSGTDPDATETVNVDVLYNPTRLNP